jgi:hypothetical protein
MNYRLGGVVAAALMAIGGITYAVDLRHDASQAMADIGSHGALESHADTAPRLATIEAVLMALTDNMATLQESQTRTEARVYDLQMLLGGRRNELVEPF